MNVFHFHGFPSLVPLTDELWLSLLVRVRANVKDEDSYEPVALVGELALSIVLDNFLSVGIGLLF